tara:strand:- start:39 stop:611 length:573 start_codon:yes stop_codon:yes gene_type:complete
MSEFNVFPYTFDNLSRIGNDTCSLDQRNIQNFHSSNYQVENYAPFCPMTNAIDFATKQPNINYKGSYQVGINGCNIDENSELKYTKVTKPACKISLQERPYLTVPYLGRGKVDPVLERQIRIGDRELNKKSLNPTSEINLSDKQNYPLISDLKQTLSDPKHYIEEAASSNWVRGGMSSREFCKKLNNNSN